MAEAASARTRGEYRSASAAVNSRSSPLRNWERRACARVRPRFSRGGGTTTSSASRFGRLVTLAGAAGKGESALAGLGDPDPARPDRGYLPDARRPGLAEPSPAEGLQTFVVTLATGWAAVWLVGFWFASRHGRLRLAAAVIVMLAVGLLSYVCDNGVLRLESLAPLLIYYIIFALALMLPMSLSSRCCRRVYSPRRFMLWLLLWTPVLLAGVMLLLLGGLALVMGFAARPSGPSRTF